EAEGIASAIGKLQSISDAALAHLELQELLPELLKRACSVFAADAAGILLSVGTDRGLTLLTADGVVRIADESELEGVERLLERALDGVPVELSRPAGSARLPGPLGSGVLRSLIA